MSKPWTKTLSLIVGNLLLTGILLIIALVGIELFLRYRIPALDFRGLSSKTDDVITVRMNPNVSITLGGVSVATNSDGYRDKEFSGTPLQGEMLIGVLGDSVTFGQVVSQDKTYPALLEKDLNALNPKRRFRVWNLGVCGYNTEQAYYVMESFLLPRKPDLVILGYNLHNFQPIDLEKQTLSKTSQQNVINKILSYLDALYTTHILKQRIGTAIRKLKPDWHASSFVNEINRNYCSADGLWHSRCLYMDKMSDLCRQNNTRLVIAILPMMLDLENYPFLESNQVLIDYFASNDVDHVDLFPHFKGKDPTQFHASPIDSHANEKAHAIFAGVLTGYVHEKYFAVTE